MKAVRYHGPRQPFRLGDVERPGPGPGEVRVMGSVEHAAALDALRQGDVLGRVVLEP